MAASPKTFSLSPGLRGVLGVSGTINIGGFIHGEEYNKILTGREGFKTFDIMARSDPTVHAALNVTKYPILAAHWKFKAPSEDPADQERADFLNREFFERKVDFYDVMGEGLTCMEFGHAVGEICYEPTTFNGQFRWGLQKLASRKQSSILRWQTSDGKPGITQLTFGAQSPNANNFSIDIPMQKLFTFTNEKRGDNYEGISLLRFAYKPWFIKDKLEMMNAVALERMGLGIPYVKEGVNNETAQPEVIAEVEAALRQIRVNEESYIKFPSSLEVGFFDMKGHTTKDILPTLQYEKQEILLSVLAQFLGLGQGGSGGSRALSDDHSKLFLRSLEAVARTMARGFQSIADRLIALNYSGDAPNGNPKLVYEDLDDDDVATVSTALAALVDKGVITPGMEVENRARRLVDIQELTEDDYKAMQAEQQAQEDKKAEQAKQLAESQAKQQPAVPPAEEKKPEVPEPKPADNKAKQKAEKVKAARDASEELMMLIAEG